MQVSPLQSVLSHFHESQTHTKSHRVDTEIILWGTHPTNFRFLQVLFLLWFWDSLQLTSQITGFVHWFSSLHAISEESAIVSTLFPQDLSSSLDQESQAFWSWGWKTRKWCLDAMYVHIQTADSFTSFYSTALYNSSLKDNCWYLKLGYKNIFISVFYCLHKRKDFNKLISLLLILCLLKKTNNFIIVMNSGMNVLRCMISEILSQEDLQA